MQNNLATVALLGLPADEPELICKVEPGEEPWIPSDQASRERWILPGNKSGITSEPAIAPAITPYRQYRGTTWTYPEVIDLLVIWREREIQQELQRSHRNIETFQVIASKMAKRGHKRSALECRSKIKTLKRDYRIAKANNSPGKGHLAWLFYDRLDHLLANDANIPPPDHLPTFSHCGASLADTISQCSTEEEPTLEGAKESSPSSHDLFAQRTQLPAEIPGRTDFCPVLRIKEEAPDETPVMPPMGIAEDSSPAPPSSSAPCDKAGSSASTADGAATPTQSPSPGPARSYAAERLANIRKRKRKNRQDLALEITQAADKRVQAATDRILAALGEYAKVDLEERERDRVDTEQIIALMNRQTELLECLVRKQAEAQAAVTPPTLTRHARLPRLGQPSHAAEPAPLRLAVPRRPVSRARYRR